MAGLFPRLAALSGLLVSGLVVGGGLAPTSQATPGDLGVVAGSFSGTGTGSPTGEKPESKLWYAEGSWWSSMQSAGGGYHVFRLDREASTWRDTGTGLDGRPSSRADVVAVGDRVYVASHVFVASSTATTAAPSYLYRLTYDAATQQYVNDGAPTAINGASSETLTLDRDSAGVLWATWMQAQAVKVASSTDDGATWSAPTTLSDPTGTPTADDISALVAFGGSLGVMWSNQSTGAMLWAEHRSGDPVGTWQPAVVAARGSNLADDHINLKADSSGRVFAAVKTSLDLTGVKTAAQVVVLARSTGGSWSSTTFGTVADCHTRPVAVIDEQAQVLHVFATGATTGCPYSGYAGTVYEKTSPLSSLSFAPGRGTPVLYDAASDNMNNPTAAKAPVNGTSGLVVVASNVTTGRYWYTDQAPTVTPTPTPTPTVEPTVEPTATPTVEPTVEPTPTATATATVDPTVPPTVEPTATTTTAPPVQVVASFTATPTSGKAPLKVQFRDTSTGSPTSWSWQFGNGTTSTLQNPLITYSKAGTYSVTLTVRNADGSSTVTRSGLITVTKKA